MTELNRLMTNYGPGTQTNMPQEVVETLATLLAEERNRASQIAKIWKKYPRKKRPQKPKSNITPTT